jgi:hypothetical protein
VVVVRGVVAALEPGYSSFVIAGKNSAVIEAGEAPRHDDHFTGLSADMKKCPLADMEVPVRGQ